MTNEARKRLLDVLGACEAIAEFVAGKDFAAYEADRLLRSGVERQFEIIGEALNKAGSAEPSLAALIPDFHHIVGLRNRLIHGTTQWTMKSFGTWCKANSAHCRCK